MFGLTVWIRSEPGFEEWVQLLGIYSFYTGIYILIASSIIVMIVAFLGCGSALMENVSGLYLVSFFFFIKAFSFYYYVRRR